MLDLQFRGSNISHLHQVVWQHAKSFHLYKYLNYAFHEDMQRQLDKLPYDGIDSKSGDKIPLASSRTTRATDVLAQIKNNWGAEFQKHIPQWPVPIGEKLVIIIVRVSKSTPLLTFAARIQQIITDRLANPHPTRSTRYNKTIMHSDLKVYLDKFTGSKPGPILKRKGRGDDTYNGDDDEEERDPGTQGSVSTNDVEDTDSMLDGKKTPRKRYTTPLCSRKTKEPVCIQVIEDISPMSVERGRGKDLQREGLDISPLRSLDGDDTISDHSQPVLLGPRPISRFASPSTFPSTPPSTRQPARLLVDLDKASSPKITYNDYCVDLRAAIKNLANGCRLNDEAVNCSLQWEVKRASTDIILESSFLLGLGTDRGNARKSWSQKRYTPSQLGKFVIAVYHPDIEHWSLVYVDFRACTVHHYDSLQDDSRVSRVFCCVKDRMLSADHINCLSKVRPNLQWCTFSKTSIDLAHITRLAHNNPTVHLVDCMRLRLGQPFSMATVSQMISLPQISESIITMPW